MPVYFKNMFDPEPLTHTYSTRSAQSRPQVSKKNFTAKCIRYLLPKMISKVPKCISDKTLTHSLDGISQYTKKYFCRQYKDKCILPSCYICKTTS